MSTILPLAYLPSVEYFTHLLRGGCVVDLGEHFVKRSERNRARILASDGVMELTVHVRNANRPRQPVRDVRLDYSKRWQHQHWMSILSAYRNSPYFDHYRDRFEPFYNREFTFLADWNIALLETVTGILGTPPALRFSDSYIEADTDDRDLRPAFEPLRANGRTTAGGVYEQVFADRFPFVPNLSVIDLLFCEGPAAKAFLTQP